MHSGTGGQLQAQHWYSGSAVAQGPDPRTQRSWPGEATLTPKSQALGKGLDLDQPLPLWEGVSPQG